MDPVTTTTSADTSASVSTPAAAPATTVNNASAALAFADSSLATPTPDPTTPAAAEVQPDPATTTPVSVDPTVDDPRSPTIPRTRFDEVVTQKNQLAEQLKQYDWAKSLQPQEVQGVAEWARALSTNPVEAALQLLSTLEADPQHAQALRSHAARTLASGRQAQAQPAADLMPEPDFQSPDGTPFYSATQQKLRDEWIERRFEKRLEERLSPLQQVAQTFQQREQSAAYTSTLQGVIADMTAADPAFEAHKKDVHAVITSDPELLAIAVGDAQTKPNPRMAVRMAWGEVYRTKVVPQQLKQSGGQALASAQQRAVAAVGANPASAAPITPASTLGNARAALLAAGVE